jgi:hypothetical protein
MATTTDDKELRRELLPADDLVAIYDDNTSTLYLYARGTYVTPTLTAFIRERWFGTPKYGFYGFYPASSDLADKPKPTEHQFAEKFYIKPRPDEVIIVTKNWPEPEGKPIKVVPVPDIQ